MRARRWILVIAVLAVSACGGPGSGVSETAGQNLRAQVAELRASAARADRNAATQRVVLLRATVDQLRADDELSAAAAARIRRALDRVESKLFMLPAPTTTTTTTTTTPPSDEGDDEKGREHPWKDKDGSRGQGRGNGNDD